MTTLTAVKRAAGEVLATRYRGCRVAFLAGSWVRGDAGETSDLDLVIVYETLAQAYRESFMYGGLPVEAFVHTRDTLHNFFEADIERRRPSLPTMVSEAVILKDNGGLAEQLKGEAAALLAAGPAVLSSDDLDVLRYQVTDLLDDLAGAVAEERPFVVAQLMEGLADFICDSRGFWRGKGKWIPRALKRGDSAIAEQYLAAFKSYLDSSRIDEIVTFAEDILEPYGGRCFDGFSRGKP